MPNGVISGALTPPNIPLTPGESMPQISTDQPTPSPAMTSSMPMPQTPAVQPTMPQLSPAQAEVLHHASFGSSVKALLHSIQGTQPVLQTNPQTGEVQEVSVPAKPGQLFRNLLAGALIGGAAGADVQRGDAGGFGPSFFRGAQAGMRNQQQTQAQALDRFKQQRQLSIEEQRAADEHLIHQATAAQTLAQTAVFHHQQEFNDQAVLDKKNAASAEYLQTLLNAGGRPAPIFIDGKFPSNGIYSAPDLAAAYVKDHSILQGPPGTVRHFVDTHNAGDLEYVEGKGWVNQSGDPVDLSKSTTVKVIDVPEDLYKKRVQRTGKELNVIAGYQLIPKDQEEHTFETTLDSISQLYAQNLKNSNQQAQAKQRTAQANKAAKANTVKRGTPAQFAQVEAKKAAALAKAEAAYEKDGNDAALASAKAAAQSAYEGEIKALGGSITPPGQTQANTTNAQPSPRITPPQGKSVVYDQQNSPHFVDSDKLKAFLADPQYRGWHQ